MLRAPKTGASREAPWEKQHLPSLSGCLIQRQVQKVPARHGWKRKGHLNLLLGEGNLLLRGRWMLERFMGPWRCGAVCSVGRGCGGSTELLQRSRCRYSYIPWRLKLMVLCAAILGSLAVCVVVKMEYLAGLHRGKTHTGISERSLSGRWEARRAGGAPSWHCSCGAGRQGVGARG